MKRKIITNIASLLLVGATIALSEYELHTKGTITGLTLLPVLGLIVMFGAIMVIDDLREMRADDLLAPDESEAEDDEW